MLRRLSAALYLRRIARDLSALTAALDRQNAVLARLADHFAPETPATDRQEVRRETGVTHLDPIEAGLALDYIERTLRDTGHTPDDEEILIYLADEKTHDLQLRLAERERELDRLAESRR